MFLWRPPSCGSPGQLPSLPSLKSGPVYSLCARVRVRACFVVCFLYWTNMVALHVSLAVSDQLIEPC